MSFPDETPDAVIDSTVKREVASAGMARRREAGRMAAEGMGVGDRMLAGAGKGFSNVMKSVLPKTMAAKLGAGTTAEEDRDYGQALGPAGKVGEVGAEIAATAIPAARGAQLAGRVIPGLASTIPRMAATTGAVTGAMTSPEHPVAGTLGGAAMGGLGGTVLRKGMERFAQPVPQDASIRMLGAPGRELTAGQGADTSQFAGRLWRALEHRGARVPWIGAPLARLRGEEAAVANPGQGFAQGIATALFPKATVPLAAGTLAAGTRTGQRVLRGDLGAQQALAEALRRTRGGDTASILAAEGGGDVGAELAELYASRRGR